MTFSVITILSIPRNLVLWKYSTVHDLTSLTKNIKKNRDEENVGFGIFVVLQKAIEKFVKHYNR